MKHLQFEKYTPPDMKVFAVKVKMVLCQSPCLPTDSEEEEDILP